MNTSRFNRQIIGLSSVMLILMIGFNSCKKEAEAEPDMRDAIVGRYEVIDSIYKPGQLDTATGTYPFVLDRVLHHPLVEASKGVFFMDDKTWEKGVLFTVVQKDDASGPYSDHGFVNDRLFQIQASVSGSLILTELGASISRNGVFKNNDMFIVYYASFPVKYSRSHLKRLP